MKCLDGPVRVLVVDDDATYRHILTQSLGQLPNARTVGTAANIASAKKSIEGGGVDVVTLDVVLGAENGLDLLSWITKYHRDVLVVLLTAGEERRASQTVDAILLGAMTLVIKPSGPGAPQKLREELAKIINNVCPVTKSTGKLPVRAATVDPLALMPRERELICIGASTGGPPVILQFLRDLPPSFQVPLLITQHMLPEHLRQFKDMLSFVESRAVRLAEDGEVLVGRGVYIAPPGKHLGVQRLGGQLAVKLLDGPEENFCRPAVDPMFRNVAEVCGRASVGVVLTGMGSDGAKGAVKLQAAGAPVVVQDEATSVVWAMPGATVAAGAASEIQPGPKVVQAILRLTSGRAGGML